LGALAVVDPGARGWGLLVVVVWTLCMYNSDGLGKGGGEDRKKKDIQLRLDTLRRRDSQQTLSNTSRETSQRRPRARDLALGVGEQPFVLVEGDES
jgi:hypothetical protein